MLHPGTCQGLSHVIAELFHSHSLVVEVLTGLLLLDAILACIWIPYRLVYGAFCSVTRIIRRGLSTSMSPPEKWQHQQSLSRSPGSAPSEGHRIPRSRLNSRLLVNHCLNRHITLKINIFPYHHYFSSVWQCAATFVSILGGSVTSGHSVLPLSEPRLAAVVRGIFPKLSKSVPPFGFGPRR